MSSGTMKDPGWSSGVRIRDTSSDLKKSVESQLRQYFDGKVKNRIVKELPQVVKYEAAKNAFNHYKGDQLPRLMVMSDEKPRDTKILDRGDYLSPTGETLTFAPPAFLPPLPAGGGVVPLLPAGAGVVPPPDPPPTVGSSGMPRDGAPMIGPVSIRSAKRGPSKVDPGEVGAEIDGRFIVTAPTVSISIPGKTFRALIAKLIPVIIPFTIASITSTTTPANRSLTNCRPTSGRPSWGT